MSCIEVSVRPAVVVECGLLIFDALRSRMANPLVIPNPSCWMV